MIHSKSARHTASFCLSVLAAEAVKLAKKERKEANGLLEKVIEEDEPRVKQKLGVGVNPDAFIDYVNY